MRERARILVVDDEPLNLEIIAEYLDDAGYDMTLFESAPQAWEHLQQPERRPYDLILLDRMMPGMDGMQLLRGIKADLRFRQTPVVMQTAATTPDQVREGIAAGAYYYLAKPYSGRELRAIVHAALEEHAAPLGSVEAAGSDAVFEFSTLQEARALATRLAMRCPEPELVAMGLGELLTNAIEHGNLGISYAEKKSLRLSNSWEIEVERRLALPEYATRKARVEVKQIADELVFTISDCGQGFDWQNYLAIAPERAYDPNGRGIAVARQLSFNRLEYRGCGNIVVATVPLNSAPRSSS
jgi:DNA-binding response OmpR family regulator